MRRRAAGAHVPVRAALLGALTVLAGLPAARVYRGDQLGWLLAGAGAGGVLVAAAAHRRPGTTVAAASVAALAGYTLLAVGVSAAAAHPPGDLAALWLDAARSGVPRLLTALVPVEPQPDTVFVPVVLTWLVGLAAVEAGLRTGRLPLGYLPPAVLYGAALWLAGPQARPAPWYALLFAAVAGAGLALDRAGNRTRGPMRHGPPVSGLSLAPRPSLKGQVPAGPSLARLRRPHPSLSLGSRSLARLNLSLSLGRLSLAAPSLSLGRLSLAAPSLSLGRLILAAPSLAGLVLAGLLGPPLAAAGRGHPVDPRRQVAPPRLTALDLNPLARLSGWSSQPDQHLLDLDIAGSTPTVVTVTLAVLGEFDGVVWRAGGGYRPAGQELPPPANSGSAGTGTGPPASRRGPAGADAGPPVVQRITIADLAGRLVPAVPVARTVQGIRVAVQPDTGALAGMSPLRPGMSYTVTSRPPRAAGDAISAARVPGGAGVAGPLSLGAQAPDDLVSLAHRIAGGNSLPYQRAAALEEFLAAHYTFAADAPSGHAYPNLLFFLTGDPAAGGQRGGPEQFAASFAVLARMLGLPSRVVVGFRTRTVRTGTHTRTSVYGRDALAWPEVLFAGYGWIPFDPLPRPGTRAIPVDRPAPPGPVPPATPPASAASPTASAPTVTAPRAGPGPVAPPGPAPAGPVIASAILVAGGAAYPVVVLALRRRLHRRRTRAGTPDQRVLGSWSELLDGLRLAGHPPGPHLAATEVAAHAERVGSGAGRTRLPVPSLRPLAIEVNRIRYAAIPTDPARSGTGGDTARAGEDAVWERDDAACAAAAAYLAELGARQPWWRRMLWSLDARPLYRPRPVRSAARR